jgi:drug/metabolite transporter (DMT)-like permease
MKSFSAAVVVLAGVALILGGGQFTHDQTGMFAQMIGVGVSLAGLVGWFMTLRDGSEIKQI